MSKVQVKSENGDEAFDPWIDEMNLWKKSFQAGMMNENDSGRNL